MEWTAMDREIRSWHIARRSDKSLSDLALISNSIVQGWINYCGFYKSMLHPLVRRINEHLMCWTWGRSVNTGQAQVEVYPDEADLNA
jgi:hypothetical protein